MKIKHFILILIGYTSFAQTVTTDSILAVLKTQKEDTAKVNTLIKLALQYRRNNPDTSLIIAGSAKALSQKLNHPLGICSAHLSMSVAYSNLGNYNEALKSCNEAMQLCNQLTLTQTEASRYKVLFLKRQAYGTFGNIYYDQGNYTEALKYNLEALKLSTNSTDSAALAQTYNNLGNIYDALGNATEAIKNMFAALKIKERMGDKKSLSNSYNNIGTTYYNQGNLDEALKFHLKALAIRRSIDDKRGIASSYNNIGVIYDDKTNYYEALKYHLDALKIEEEIKDQRGKSISLNNIGHVYLHQNNTKEALKYFAEYLAISQNIEDQSGIADACINMGNANVLLKKYPEATLQLHKALSISLQISNIDLIKDSYDALTKLHSATGNYKQAFENHKMFVIYRDSLFNEANTKKLVEAQMLYDFDKKEAMDKVEQDKKDALASKELQKQKLMRNAFIAGFLVVLLFAIIFLVQRNKISKAKKVSEAEKKRSESLLLNILPAEVAEELKQTGQCKAKTFSMVTVMFADFKDFTHVSEKISAELLVGELNACFSSFDNILQKYKIEKIKTVGDAYLCVSGLPTLNYTHAEDIVKAAIEMKNFILNRKKEKETNNEIAFEIRIGIHTGPVVAGIVGIKKYAYDIWGDTVNLAARMESCCQPGFVNISDTTYAQVKDKFQCEYRGKINAKNKGDVDMYFVDSIT